MAFYYLVVVILALLLFYWYTQRRPPNFPPGPNPLPIIGTLHITRGRPHKAGIDLMKKYGPIIGMKVGEKWSVLIHGVDLIRETLSDQVFNGRNVTEANSFILGDEYGILQASGSIWSEQRRFAMKTLRDFGFGRASMEEMIEDEAKELCDRIRKKNGEAIELKRRFSLAVVNSLWRILTGERYDHDDPQLNSILDKLDSSQSLLVNQNSPLKIALIRIYPKIAKFFGNYTGWNKLVQHSETRKELFERIINDHEATLQEDNPRDFVDMHLLESKNTTDERSSFHYVNSKRSLVSVMSDLFFAGTDTTSVTLIWSMFYLLRYPEKQEKLYREIEDVVGKARLPKLADRKSLPYTECFIMEILRISSIIPSGGSRMIDRVTKYHGFTLPKGTFINPNYFQVHHDPKVWGDPEVFRPERFLREDGSCMQRHDHFIPFSVGRRVCMGENLARDTLFLFLTNIVYNFQITLPKGDTKLPIAEHKPNTLALQPYPFKVSLQVR